LRYEGGNVTLLVFLLLVPDLAIGVRLSRSDGDTNRL